MGLDIHSRVVVGIKVSFLRKEKREKFYDKNSGRPYIEKTFCVVCEKDESMFLNEGLKKFNFGYLDEEDVEYKCIYGVSIYYSDSNRSEESEFGLETFLEIDPDILSKEIFRLKSIFPKENVKAYCFSDANW